MTTKNNSTDLLSLRARFNSAVQQESAVSPAPVTSSIGLSAHEDRLINAAHAAGADTGFMGRADQFGFQEARLKEEKHEKEKRNKLLRQLTPVMKEIIKSIDSGIDKFKNTINDGYILAQDILGDITYVDSLIQSATTAHDLLKEAVDTGDSSVIFDETGKIKSKDIQDMLERACNRTGQKVPDDPVKIMALLQEQMVHEEQKYLPFLTVQKNGLSNLYDNLIVSLNGSESVYAGFVAERERILQMEASPEQEKQARSLDRSIKDNEAAFETEFRAKREQKNELKNSIEKASQIGTEPDPQISIAQNTDSGFDSEFTFGDQPQGNASTEPKPGF